MTHHGKHRVGPTIDRVVIGVLFIIAIYVAVIWSILSTKPRHIITRPEVNVVAPPPVAVPVEPAPIVVEPDPAPELRGAIDLPEVHSEPAAVDDAAANPAAVEPAAIDPERGAAGDDRPRGRVPYPMRRPRAPHVAIDPDVPRFPAWMTPGTFD